MEQKAISLLKQSGLRVTPVRGKVIELFIASGQQALSNTDIEQQFDRLDRTTLYRTLRTLEEKGIIHQVLDNSNVQKYAFGSDQHLGDEGREDHVHFHCTLCEKTVCLEDTFLPKVKVPDGFRIEQKHMVLSGTCDRCSD